MAKKDDFANMDLLDIGFNRGNGFKRSKEFIMSVPSIDVLVKDIVDLYPDPLSYALRVPASFGSLLDGSDTSKFEAMLRVVVYRVFASLSKYDLDLVMDFLSASVTSDVSSSDEFRAFIRNLVSLLNSNGFLDPLVKARVSRLDDKNKEEMAKQLQVEIGLKDQVSKLRADVSMLQSRVSVLASESLRLNDTNSSLQSKLDALGANFKRFKASYFHIPKLRTIKTWLIHGLGRIKNYILRPFRAVKRRF